MSLFGKKKTTQFPLSALWLGGLIGSFAPVPPPFFFLFQVLKCAPLLN